MTANIFMQELTDKTIAGALFEGLRSGPTEFVGEGLEGFLCDEPACFMYEEVSCPWIISSVKHRQ
jgi:hypothetical protein